MGLINWLRRNARSNKLHDDFWHAMFMKDWKAVERLAQEGASLSQLHSSIEPNPPLVFAVEYEAPLTLIGRLIELGAPINKSGEGDSTALMYAVSKGQVAVVKYLLEKGADVDIKNARNLKAIDIAKRRLETRPDISPSDLKEIIEILEQHSS